MWKRKLEVEPVKFFWKLRHFEERSWKRKQTRKRLTLYGSGSGSKKYSTAFTSLIPMNCKCFFCMKFISNVFDKFSSCSFTWTRNAISVSQSKRIITKTSSSIGQNNCSLSAWYLSSIKRSCKERLAMFCLALGLFGGDSSIISGIEMPSTLLSFSLLLEDARTTYFEADAMYSSSFFFLPSSAFRFCFIRSSLAANRLFYPHIPNHVHPSLVGQGENLLSSCKTILSGALAYDTSKRSSKLSTNALLFIFSAVVFRFLSFFKTLHSW